MEKSGKLIYGHGIMENHGISTNFWIVSGNLVKIVEKKLKIEKLKKMKIKKIKKTKFDI